MLEILNFSEQERDLHRQLFPSRNTFTFDQGLTVTSNFDQGNLLKCLKGDPRLGISSDKPLKNIAQLGNEEYYAFECWICPDGWPYLPEMNLGRAGFFFAVTGVPEAQKRFDSVYGCEVEVPRNIRVHLKNMSNQGKLLSYGHKIVTLEVSQEDFHKLSAGELPMYRQKWQRLQGEIDY